MNMLANREFVAQAVIVLAACVGAWFMLVESRMRELQELESVIELASEGDGVVTEQLVEQLADRVSEIRQQVAAVRSRNRLAQDSSQLYALVMDLAEATGVDVQSLEPGERPTEITSDAPRIVSIDVTVSGAYDSIARFVEQFKTLDGFVRPASIQLSPRGDTSRPIVTARIVCEVLEFALPETLAAMGGEVHAQHHR